MTRAMRLLLVWVINALSLTSGTLVDQMGMIPVAPVYSAEFDGTTFKADVKAQTPPDGAERILKIEAKLAEGKLSGALNVPDMGLALPFTGTKK